MYYEKGALDNSDVVYYVVDGGSLLHKLPRKRKTFKDICNGYHE